MQVTVELHSNEIILWDKRFDIIKPELNVYDAKMDTYIP